MKKLTAVILALSIMLCAGVSCADSVSSLWSSLQQANQQQKDNPGHDELVGSVICSCEGVTVTVDKATIERDVLTGKYRLVLEVSAKNSKSNTPLVIIRDAEINGMLVDPICAIEAAGYKTTKGRITIYLDKVGVRSMDKIRSMEFVFAVQAYGDNFYIADRVTLKLK